MSNFDNRKSYLGEYLGYAGIPHRLGLSDQDRMRHIYLIGKTGSGKSTMLKNILIQDILKGNGICLIDPHGDLAEEVLNSIPSRRLEDVVYFDPADRENVIGFNPFDVDSSTDKDLVASALISTFKNLWSDSWGPRLEYILLNTILALLEVSTVTGVTLLAIPRMLTDDKYRRWVVSKIKDPKVKMFWLNEFAGYNKREIMTVISPILNKVGAFISSPLLRNILGQVQSSFSIKKVMDNKQILIVNLAKGKIGEDRANLLGSLIVSAIQIEAMKRSYIEEEERVPFFLYLDEFQNFGTDSFISILSEARKYRLSLTIAHQYIDQIKPTIRSAVVGNVGTLILFSMASCDAEFFSTEFKNFPVERMVEINLGEVLIRQFKNGKNQEPVRLQCFPPVDLSVGLKNKIIAHSKMRFCKDRQGVEGKINRFYGC